MPTVTTTIQETKVLWDKTDPSSPTGKLYVWDDASKAWELFFVAANLVTNDALTADLALKVNKSGDTMTGALQLTGMGVGTAPDPTNKVSAVTNAVLFADLGTGSGGTGDIRTILSKQASTNTASFLFQDAFSGRAEIGLTGDDDFHFKVSPDGSTFTDALKLNRTTGQATLATFPIIAAFTQGSVLFGGASGVLAQDNANLFWDAVNHRLGIGTVTPGAALEVLFTGGQTQFANGSSFQVTIAANNTGPATGVLQKARGTIAVPLVVVTNDALGSITFRGYDGVSAYQRSASMAASVIDTSPGATAMGGELTFNAAAIGSAALTKVAAFRAAYQAMLGPFTIGAIAAPTTSALLDLSSTTGALLIPRMTTTQKSALTATAGMIVYDSTLGGFQKYESGTWIPLGQGLALNGTDIGTTTRGKAEFTQLGINAASDATNKLSVSSSAVLFNNAGTDFRLSMNKNAAGNTASTLYETGFSGRAEVGLTGDDNFHFKVSPDGSSWTDALILDKTTGLATHASNIVFSPPSSATPSNNGQVTFQLTSNTSLAFKAKGSDGVVRSGSITLS